MYVYIYIYIYITTNVGANIMCFDPFSKC